MDIKIEVDTREIDHLERRLNGLDQVVRAYGNRVVAAAVLALQTGPKSGKTYRIGAKTSTVKTGGKRDAAYSGMRLKGKADGDTGKTRYVTGSRIHRASRKGEAPATDTGNLAGSAFVKRSGKWEVEAGFSAEYAERLETEMERPYLLPALESVKDDFVAAVESVLKGNME